MTKSAPPLLLLITSWASLPPLFCLKWIVAIPNKNLLNHTLAMLFHLLHLSAALQFGGVVAEEAEDSNFCVYWANQLC